MTKSNNAMSKKYLTVKRVMDHLNDEKIRGLGVGLWYYAPDTDSFELCEEEQMDEVDGIIMPFKEDLVSFSDVFEALEEEPDEDFELYDSYERHRIVSRKYGGLFLAVKRCLLEQKVEEWLEN